MQDDTYEPVRPSINGQGQNPSRQDYDGEDSEDGQNSNMMSGGVKSQHSQQQSFTSQNQMSGARGKSMGTQQQY